VKILFANLVFLAFAVGRQDAGAPVPAEQEPLHHVVLRNESVVVMHLTLPAGERTLYHTHTHDRVAIHLSGTSITQQKANETEGPPMPISPGAFSAMTFDGSPYTHRVHNVGSGPFDVLDVELLGRPQTPWPVAAAPVAAENPSARVYNWVLAPGAKSPAHTHLRPYLLVAATGFPLKITAPDGQSATHEVKAGEVLWVDGKRAHSLGNAGTVEGQVLEIELK
jgi:quercetin dioxygenase-like cupin family protein